MTVLLLKLESMLPTGMVELEAKSKLLDRKPTSDPLIEWFGEAGSGLIGSGSPLLIMPIFISDCLKPFFSGPPTSLRRKTFSVAAKRPRSAEALYAWPGRTACAAGV